MLKELLSALDCMHSRMILHRDVKTDNILVTSDGHIKLADLGLSKKTTFGRRNSNAIVSLYYRAPEIIIGSDDYFFGVDIWSAGCVFADLLTCNYLFQATSEKDAIARIFAILGTPKLDLFEKWSKLSRFSRIFDESFGEQLAKQLVKPFD